MSTANQQPHVPFLPGYRVDLQPKANHHKTHMFDVNSGIRVDLNRELTAVDPRSLTTQPAYVSAAALSSTSSSTASKEEKEQTTKAYVNSNPFTSSSAIGNHVHAATLSRLPAWVAYDRKVLRFSAYFKESIVASSVESWRLRKCVIYYYLEDDSIHIAEPKVENSGIPQGVFIKRHRIPRSANNQHDYFNFTDLYIGSDLPVYGRVFHIVDCDNFTRDFYAANNIQLADSEQYPTDSFTTKQLSTVKHNHHKVMNPLKFFMEATLGKPNTNPSSTRQFLQNDGKVLRFYCTWNDDKMYGEVRPYILHYFLADDTAEVLEISQPNSGRDSFPVLLRRGKLPRNFAEATANVAKIGLQNDSNENNRFYTESDLRVGEYVNVYGRNLLICGADRFTQDYYIENYGMSVDDFPRINMDDSVTERPKMIPPPYNGYGTEEDSLGSFLYLMPKVPKPDFKKFMENDGINIRFLAKLVNPKKVDQNRRFIIVFYMNNDTIGVFEKIERNSGFIGGKFLERSRLKNPATDEYFKANDLYVGSEVTINHFQFELIECDEYTRKFISNNPQIWKNIVNQPNQTQQLSKLSAEELANIERS